MFYNASGSKVSTNKTKIFFSKNVAPGLTDGICRHSEFEKVDYLGKNQDTPLLNGRMTKETLSFVVDNIR